MGDRCYLELRLRGRIETVEAFEEIAKMFEDNCWAVNDFNRVTNKEYSIREALARDEESTFYLSECNYAQIDEEEDILQGLGVPYEVSHDEGGGYPAGVWSWSEATGKVETIRAHGEGAVVSITELEEAMAQPDPLAAIRAIIDAGNAAEGCDLPGYSLSDEVRAYLGMRVDGAVTPATEPQYVNAAEGI